MTGEGKPGKKGFSIKLSCHVSGIGYMALVIKTLPHAFQSKIWDMRNSCRFDEGIPLARCQHKKMPKVTEV